MGPTVVALQPPFLVRLLTGYSNVMCLSWKKQTTSFQYLPMHVAFLIGHLFSLVNKKQFPHFQRKGIARIPTISSAMTGLLQRDRYKKAFSIPVLVVPRETKFSRWLWGVTVS